MMTYLPFRQVGQTNITRKVKNTTEIFIKPL